MCLYEQRMKNPHYLTNEKNRGIIPTPEDIRHLEISVGCGWCEECRKKLANEWRIEMFCHGALCMAISGKCYLSLNNTGRSANRGECMQLCPHVF